MAAGVPIVATAVGGVPEIVTDQETALLVPPRAATALAQSMRRVLADQELAPGLTARAAALVTENYSPEQYAQSVLRLYREVIEARKLPLS